MLAAADLFEVLAAVILFLITGIAQWVQQRNQKKKSLPPESETGPFADPFGRTADDSAPAPPPQQSFNPADDWEAQLRRILHGDPAPPPPLPPALPTPSRVTVAGTPAPPPLGTGGHDEASDSWETADAPWRPLATLDRAEAAVHRGEQLDTTTGVRLTGVGRLATATNAINHAANLHDAVAARMRDVLSHTDSPSAYRPSTSAPLRAAPAAAATLGLLRNPATVRQAFVASVVFQKPKALE